MSKLPSKDNIMIMKLFSRTNNIEGNCFLWNGATNGEYGKISYRAKPVFTHRLTYMLCIGEIDSKNEIIHTCNNKLCLNPLHLKSVTRSVRHKKAINNGTAKSPLTIKGQDCKHSKLDNAAVIDIFNSKDYATRADMSIKYGVSKETIKNIRCRKSWRHLTVDL